MIAEINAALTSLNLLTKMAKSALDAHTETEVRKVVREFDAVICELHQRIIEIQLQEQELIRAKLEAEQKLIAYDKWETEKAKYALKKVAKDVFVYELQPAHAAGQPIHHICPKCYEARQKGILQRQNEDWDGMYCPVCDAVYAY
jgi:PHP family Zn ribbon phosphoesterase